MKHYIIVKFKEGYDWEGEQDEIRKIFLATEKYEGVEKVEVRTSCSDRPNRAHLMILIHMTPEGLKNYDASAEHRTWKEVYGPHFESKMIFDCEE